MSERGKRVTAAAALLAGSVLLSRVLGYVREAVLADQLGVSGAVDAYRAAFQLPDLLNHFLAGGALSIAFIPLYTRVRSASGDAAADRFFAMVLGGMGLVAIAATVGIWLYADALVALQFPRFDPEAQALTVRLTRIVLPAQFFFITGGIVRGVLMARGRFVSQALAPVLYNLGIITGGLWLGETRGAEGFAWGALAGAFVGPFLVPVIEIWRRREVRLRVRVAFGDRDFWRYIVVAAPLMIGATLLTVDEWFDRWFGALLDEGTVAQLAYARYLMLVPVAVLGQAIATAALPTLSELWSEGRRDELDRTLENTLRVALGLSMLFAAAFAAFPQPMVELLYRHGAFNDADAARCASLLTIFAWGVPAWVTQQIAIRAFYARGDTWRPMLLGTAVAAAAVPLYLALGSRSGGAGLAVAGVLAMSTNAVLTLALARRLHGAPSLVRLASTGARSLVIALLAGFAAAQLAPKGAGDLAAILELVVGGAIFAALAVPLAFVVGDEPLREGIRRLARRLRP